MNLRTGRIRDLATLAGLATVLRCREAWRRRLRGLHRARPPSPRAPRRDCPSDHARSTRACDSCPARIGRWRESSSPPASSPSPRVAAPGVPTRSRHVHQSRRRSATARRGGRPMTMRLVLRRAAAAILAASAALQAASLAAAHSPDPPIAWPLFEADDVLQFRWKEGEVPPPRCGMPSSQAQPVQRLRGVAGALDRVCRRRRVDRRIRRERLLRRRMAWPAPTAGTRPTASASPSEPTAGSSTGAASSGASSSRRSPTAATTSRTSRSTSSGTSSGLGHHVNYGDESDYLDAVVQTISRARPKAGLGRRRVRPLRRRRSSSFATTWSTPPGSIRRAWTWRRPCRWPSRTPRSGSAKR